MVWANPAMKTYLNRPSGLLSHFEHGLAFTNGVAGRLLDKDVSTHLHGCNAGKGMPMVGVATMTISGFSDSNMS